jgi:hypothetical protein
LAVIWATSLVRERKNSNVEQLPVDDIRRVTQLLSPAAFSKIQAVKAEAVSELLADLARYWETVSNFEALKQHEAIELVPLFDRYAERQYDSYAKELLSILPDIEEFALRLAIPVTDSLINEIRPKNGFMTKFPLSGEWTELIPILKACSKEESDLAEPDGEWEMFLQRSFARQLAKSRIAIKRWDAANLKALERLCSFFHLKFRFYLRLFPNWHSFDLRLRAHLAIRLEYWEAQAYRRAILPGDEIEVSKVRGSSDARKRGYRTEIKQWMKDKKIETIPGAAKRLGVGFDILKSIMTNKGKKRYSDKTLQDVLKKIGQSTP